MDHLYNTLHGKTWPGNSSKINVLCSTEENKSLRDTGVIFAAHCALNLSENMDKMLKPFYKNTDVASTEILSKQ